MIIDLNGNTFSNEKKNRKFISGMMEIYNFLICEEQNNIQMRFFSPETTCSSFQTFVIGYAHQASSTKVEQQIRRYPNWKQMS